MTCVQLLRGQMEAKEVWIAKLKHELSLERKSMANIRQKLEALGFGDLDNDTAIHAALDALQMAKDRFMEQEARMSAAVMILKDKDTSFKVTYKGKL